MKSIDAKVLQRMFLAGAKGLEAKKEWINELNVFPVPDGDTGTNMTLTIMAAAKEVSVIEDVTMENLAKAISSGSLRGARGNSGVILSQLFRGFTKEIKTVEKITAKVMADALQRASETAYKAVMKPKEGTILTVARGIAEKAAELTEIDDITEMEDLLRELIEHGDYVLSKTPDMLPVLKQAGVVDSGGQGLMQVIKGAFDGFLGKEVDLTIESGRPAAVIAPDAAESAHIEFGYCTEFIVNVEKAYSDQTEQQFKDYLESIGDSIVVVSDEDVIKVHVHTNDPGLAIQKALTYGSLTNMKIDNMRFEHQEKLIKDAERLAKQQEQKAAVPEEKKPYGFIAVSAGAGLGEIFRGIGVDYLIEGGQTMNPSTEDMLNAIDQVNAETIFILPNNKNIILAAEQARNLTKDKKIIVLPTKTIPQGITAVINFVPDKSPEENEQAMAAEISRVKTGQITYAVRNTMIEDKEIHEGDIMGIGDSSLLAVGKSIQDTAAKTLGAMISDDSEMISIYYGSDVLAEDADSLYQTIVEKYPDCDVDLQSGGQPIYYYILSVE